MIWLALLYIVFISFLTKYIFYGFKLFHILIFSPLNLRFYVFSLERNFHYESRNVETENLKVIKKLTLNMIKQVKKRGNDQQTENLQLFLKTGNGPKKRGNRSTN